MKKFKTKLATLIIAILIMAFILPIQVLGANAELTDENLADYSLQIIKTDNGDYIVYIKDLQNKEFEFTITQSSETKEFDLNYEKSLQDDAGNEVVFVSEEDYKGISEKDNYLYVRKDGETLINGEKLDFNSAFTKSQMEYVENTMKTEKTEQRIATELITDIIEKDEIVNEVKIKVTVGGLKVIEKENSKYYYGITKLPKAEYDTLKELADRINEEYETTDMYSKIELAKEFYEAYNSLASKQDWKEVEASIIMQPDDAQKGEQYVVYLKEVNENQEEVIDVRIMTSYREYEEEKIPARTETKVVKETAKLPITGDSIVLFVILAVILFVAIIVFVRMKNLQNKEEQK